MSESSERQKRPGRDTQKNRNKYQTDRNRPKQTETDMLSELATVSGIMQRTHHSKKKAGDREKERERELRARLRDTHMEKETEIKHKRERERDTERKRQRSIKHTGSKQQGSLPEAARPS